ncbi:MAG: 5-methyltetrahydropteroyltriglutamate--homocysteine S-methyltransferase, partial [Myxococcota bacterium]
MNQENTTPITTNLGFPRVGLRRELKRAVEGYWKGRVERDDLLATARSLRQRHWTQQREAGIEHIPSNDFALYDHVLDAAITVGCIPPRYLAIEDELDRMFAMARGRQGEDSSLAALEMTKWFDTNYHYIVPEIAVGQSFELDARHILAAIEEARDLGIETRPVLLGPVSFLLLSKMTPGAPERAAPLDSLEELLPVYGELLHTLASAGVAWVQLDEPCLVTDLEETAVGAYRRAFSELAAIEDRPRVLLASYFGALGPHLNLAASSGLDALHVDLVRAPEQLDEVLTALRDAPEMLLSLGLVNGRNIWRADLDRAHEMTRKALAALGAQRVMVGPSCSLLHSPVDLDAEQELSDELRPWLAFGVQKLEEIRTIADIAPHAEPSDPRLEESRRAVASRRSSQSTRVPAVRARLSEVNEALLQRASAFTERARSQRELLQLPAFPTTTIGSFPQTRDIRRARADWRA